MEYISGIIIGLLVAWLGMALEYDKEKSFYPIILIVIAMYYVLFAVIDGNGRIIFLELTVATLFVAIAIFGANISLFIVSIGLISHGIFDYFHDDIITNSGVPDWWPSFCAAVDVVLGFFVLYLAKNRSNKSLQQTAEAAAE